ncbi:BZ3500_MvSof-1268-A1-R1_Chr8-1g09770 [Microbotryum saponariae]|uniref:BZ3500_MvSof-1268-A1-R1_Chr8-1g09770 protein n=1 Tax=Microbotryum saponariae TaxID=289078 RepID=A0A2X0KV91_9BASI|nr:BZ3500_MvSof-1268-A1-R1_Chr8-1g09770 [Microbotryum saponariae]SDA08056.1 BZ3501_MvSof-1269-A2-R1_Chr8-1g09493 [Microbotryum saponariae]
MFFARSGVVAATLLVLQSTLSIAAPLSDKAVHELEKRISCHTNEIAKNNACVSCASLYTNATTCSRSAPLTCSYGEVNSKRQCAAVDCSKSPATYLSADGKQCLPCNDPNALTCTSTTTLSCNTDYTLLPNNTCVYGTPYGQNTGYGLIKNFAPSNQPFKPYTPADGDTQNCARAYTKAKGESALCLCLLGFIFFIGESFDPATCTGQNAPLDMNLVAANDPTAVVLVKGNCTLLAQSSFVKANKANCQQVFIGPQSPMIQL